MSHVVFGVTWYVSPTLRCYDWLWFENEWLAEVALVEGEGSRIKEAEEFSIWKKKPTPKKQKEHDKVIWLYLLYI
jgi:hypothetical protein